jgi:hypothetical protein
MTSRGKLPLERAIAEKTDRRAKYEKAQRDAGFCKTSMWVPCDCLDDIRLLVKILGATNGDGRAALKELCNRNFGK